MEPGFLPLIHLTSRPVLPRAHGIKNHPDPGWWQHCPQARGYGPGRGQMDMRHPREALGAW